MDQLLNKLTTHVPSVTFTIGSSFYWSPEQQSITYINKKTTKNIWALLHEVSHAILNHQSYKSDFELLQLEVAAWDKAEIIAQELGYKIDYNHIQDCLDTYRDWLHQRSTCPSCSSVCFQSSPNEYRCHNCYTVWHVSNSRFCRPYRLRGNTESKKPSGVASQTTFA